MNSAKFITLDNGLTILIYSDKSKSTNHVELITFFGGNNTSFRDKNDLVKKVHKGTAHLLEHYICEQTDYGNLISNLKNLMFLVPMLVRIVMQLYFTSILCVIFLLV